MSPPRMVLGLFDASPAAANAAWRAGLAARDLGAVLHLLHPGAEATAPASAVASEIAHRLRTPVQLLPVEGDLLQQALRAAREALLLVIGAPRLNPLRELVLGTQAERLIRLSPAPVLVVKRAPSGSYRRVLVPVDQGPDATSVIAAACRLSRDPRMEVFHALATQHEVSLRVADVPEAVVRRLRRRAEQRTGAALESLIAQAGASSQGVLPAVGFGDPAMAVLRRADAMRAELLVMGKRRRGLLADFFLGSVTQRVLARTRADVLVLTLAGKERALRGLLASHA